MSYYTYLSTLCWAGTYLSTLALEHKLPTRIPQVSICYLLVTWDSTQCHQAGILFHFFRVCRIDHSVTLIWKPLHKRHFFWERHHVKKQRLLLLAEIASNGVGKKDSYGFPNLSQPSLELCDMLREKACTFQRHKGSHPATVKKFLSP